MNHTLNVKVVNRYKVKPDTEREFKELRLWFSSAEITRGISGCI